MPRLRFKERIDKGKTLQESKNENESGNDESEENLFDVQRSEIQISDDIIDDEKDNEKIIKKEKKKTKKIMDKVLKGTAVTGSIKKNFDSDNESESEGEDEEDEADDFNLDDAKNRLLEADKDDRVLEKDEKKRKKLEKKIKEKSKVKLNRFFVKYKLCDSWKQLRLVVFESFTYPPF